MAAFTEKPPATKLPASWAADFEAFLSVELPSRLRAKLERHIECDLRITDDRLKRRAANLVKSLALDSFREFVASRMSSDDATVTSPSNVFEQGWDADPASQPHADAEDDGIERDEAGATPRARSTPPASTSSAGCHQQPHHHSSHTDADQLPPPPPPFLQQPHLQQLDSPNWIDMLDPLSFAGYDTECDVDFDFGQGLDGGNVRQRTAGQVQPLPGISFAFGLEQSDQLPEEERDITEMLQMQKYFDSGYESSGEDWGRL